MKEQTEKQSLKDMLIEYTLKAKAMDRLYQQTVELEKIISTLDKDIEEIEKTGLDGLDETVDVLCKVRNSLNLERLELEIHICKLKLWLAEFEKARQLAR